MGSTPLIENRSLTPAKRPSAHHWSGRDWWFRIQCLQRTNLRIDLFECLTLDRLITQFA
jgi:hypothetical protein